MCIFWWFEFLYSLQFEIVFTVEDEASRLSQIEQSNSASDVIKSLISKGTNDFNSQTSNGVLPLCVAVRLGCLSLVQFMLEKEVNPNSMDGMEETPLYLSLKSGQMDTSKLLLDAKADVNYPGNTSGEISYRNFQYFALLKWFAKRVTYLYNGAPFIIR